MSFIDPSGTVSWTGFKAAVDRIVEVNGVTEKVAIEIAWALARADLMEAQYVRALAMANDLAELARSGGNPEPVHAVRKKRGK